MPTLVMGSPGCHDEMPKGTCSGFQALSDVHWHHAMSHCDTDYGFGHLTAFNATHMYFEYKQTGVNKLLGGQELDQKSEGGDFGVDVRKAGLSDEQLLNRLRSDVGGSEKYSPILHAIDDSLSPEQADTALLEGIRKQHDSDRQPRKESLTSSTGKITDYMWIVTDEHGPRDYC